ncbi:hypothetical protein BCIN_06g00310 [Botrytis cinerea B05.10]|uniref:Uncharacterized protein n=2 Tax=Botryotinia fuckeliana TaxID=40559 RepID=A0A384JIV8_BOTFB|nr:hypothetical protein BCIN_06g00310 [Botrytis cinerea B05.10]ATZ50529.1 hypothetical protein BCIN_06g00310 [Botrytis cinerea B05.10]CCD49322.1 hypothetical protein BofuT4_P031980.1 [Botrytis cinerea T4]
MDTSHSTKNSNRLADSANPKHLKSINRIIRDAGFRSMPHFMASYGLQLNNDEHLAQAYEIIERMYEMDLTVENLRRLEFRRGSDEENVEDNRGAESWDEEDRIVETCGLVEVVGYGGAKNSNKKDPIVETCGLVEVVGYGGAKNSKRKDPIVETCGLVEVVGYGGAKSSVEEVRKFGRETGELRRRR